MTRKIRVAVALIGAAAILLSAAQAQPPAATVKATDALQFVPRQVTVTVGDTVRWDNTSALVHSVTDVPAKALDPADVALPEDAKPFNSGFLDPGANYEHRFTKPGTYRYFCIPHEATGMVATVRVKPKE